MSPTCPATSELREALEPLLTAHGLKIRPNWRLERRASPDRSSYPLEELSVELQDGRFLDLIFKNVSPGALSETVRRAKPAFLEDPYREIAVYRTVLQNADLGTATYYGSVIDDRRRRNWLFLEKLAGRPLHEFGDFEIWKQAARWLAAFHCRFIQAGGNGLIDSHRLVHHDAGLCHRWMQRAKTFLTDSQRASIHERAIWEQLCECYPRYVNEFLALPRTMLHGEFYASNVIIRDGAEQHRVSPVDWERAAIGPGLVDLAALTSGSWSHAQRRDLAVAYYDVWKRRNPSAPDFKTFVRSLELCRLHVAVQWLGWLPDWSPPPDQRQDWFSEATAAAKRMNDITC
jgi:hypothetical protein